MPCAGPTEAEVRGWEREANRFKFGKSWTDNEWTENVACAYTAHVRHKTPLPAWAILWSDEHERKDRARQQAEKNRKEEEEAKEYAEFVRLERKFRKPSGGK